MGKAQRNEIDGNEINGKEAKDNARKAYGRKGCESHRTERQRGARQANERNRNARYIEKTLSSQKSALFRHMQSGGKCGESGNSVGFPDRYVQNRGETTPARKPFFEISDFGH